MVIRGRKKKLNYNICQKVNWNSKIIKHPWNETIILTINSTIVNACNTAYTSLLNNPFKMVLKEDKWNWKERWDFGAIITLLKDFSLSIIQEEQLLYHHPRLIVFLFSCFMSCSMIWLFLLLCWPYLGDKRQIKSDKKIWVGRFSIFNWILAISSFYIFGMKCVRYLNTFVNYKKLECTYG